MKLRTSLCNPTALRKDITRFAPVWVLYTVGLLMVMTVVMIDYSEYFRAANLSDTLSFMAAVNLCYGFLNGQLLFGDLFNARHCNALHAMPLRRECWFVTHVVSGMLFALVPNLVFTLVCMTMLGAGWTVAIWWFLATAMQYLFFFGLAALSALCVGNRFAMLLVYGIINFFALIVYWFYFSIYEPLLYGVFLTEEPFVLWCPIWQMCDHYNMIVVDRVETLDDMWHNYDYNIQSVTLGEGWGYLGICAVLGVAFFGIALLLYRRRKLESAGDFMAVRALEPVFLVLYTVSMAAGFQAFAELFGISEYIFLILGLIVGFFTGRMLLMRTTRVFQPRGFLWFGILAAAFALSMVLTWLDPLGVTSYVPDTDEISFAKISNHYYPQNSDNPMLTDEADLETVCQIHKLAVENPVLWQDAYVEYNTLSVLYHLKNGATVTRRYDVACNSPAGKLAETFYTRADFVLGTDNADDFMKYLERVNYDTNKFISDHNSGMINGEIYLTRDNEAFVRGLVEAILADCAEGTMAQSGGYHAGEDQYGWIEFSMNLGEDSENWYDYRSLAIYSDNRHTVAYLEENPFPTDNILG